MVLNNLLIEETHDLSKIDEIANIILAELKEKLKGKLKRRNIIFFSKELQEMTNNNIIFVIIANIDISAEYNGATIGVKNNEKIKGITLNLFNHLKMEEDNKIELDYDKLKTTIKHELVHIFDSIKIYLKTGKYIQREIKKTNDFTLYRSEPEEINAFIHFVKAYKEKVGKSYDIMFPTVASFIKTMINKDVFNKIKGKLSWSSEKHVIDFLSNKKYKEMILKRLYRENLLPLNLRNKI